MPGAIMRSLTALTVFLAGLLASQSVARAGTLECDGLRRLSDNFLLDLQVRMVFDPTRHRYTRLENTGRGWQEIEGSFSYRVVGQRLVLNPNPYVTSYLERLTGAYYYIDSTGTTLSIWGHCGVVGPVRPVF